MSGKPGWSRERRPAADSWDAVACWYDGWVGARGSRYHQGAAIPVVLDLLRPCPGESILDVGACVRDAKERLGYAKVVLAGWSGGGSPMMGYQAEAEKPSITETAAGEPFLAFMRNQIFDPLEMDDTRADPSTEATGDRATSYFPRFASDPRYGYHAMRPVEYSCYAGASVFVSTPSDLVRFALAVNGGKLLQPNTARLLQTSLRLPSGEDTGYGLGWDLETVTLAGNQVRVVGHDGDTLGGMVSSLMTFPDGLVVAVTSNISYADTYAVGLKIAEAFAKPAQQASR